MTSTRWLLALVLLGSTMAVSGAKDAAGDDDPAALVRALYKIDLKHFGFDKEILKIDRPYLAPDLYAGLLKQANKPVAPGDAPDIEEDVIFNAQELPTHYSVGKASIEGTSSRVGVDLEWDKEKLHYTVFLRQIDGAWKVTEIDYGKDGKLTDLLK
jgi:hypothetical protein